MRTQHASVLLSVKWGNNLHLESVFESFHEGGDWQKSTCHAQSFPKALPCGRGQGELRRRSGMVEITMRNPRVHFGKPPRRTVSHQLRTPGRRPAGIYRNPASLTLRRHPCPRGRASPSLWPANPTHSGVLLPPLVRSSLLKGQQGGCGPLWPAAFLQGTEKQSPDISRHVSELW